MPFYRVKIADDETESLGDYEQDETDAVPYPTSANQVPIFLIPGIFGNATELTQLVQKLHNTNRPIYVYYDSRFIANDASNTKGKLSLTEQAKSIANSMIKHLAKGPAPYIIAGYSFGCPLAALAAQELKELGQESHLYMIDGASPEAAKEYFTTLSLNALSDLKNIVNYAAKLCNLNQFNYDESQTRIDLSLSCDKVIDSLASYVLENNIEAGHTTQQKFATLISIAKQNIQNLITFTTDSSTLTNLDQITALITTRTANKYNDEACGWDKYTDKLLLVNNTRLIEQEHIDLLLAENAGILANSIKLFIRKQVTYSDFLIKFMNYLLQQCTENNPDGSEQKDEDELDAYCSSETSGSSSSPSMRVPNNSSPTTTERSSDTATPMDMSPADHSPTTERVSGDTTPPDVAESDVPKKPSSSIREQFRLFSRTENDTRPNQRYANNIIADKIAARSLNN